MTDEELDRVRADHAYGIAMTEGEPGDQSGFMRRYGTHAARLARECWKPVDPLLVEARRMASINTIGPSDYISGALDDTSRVQNFYAGLKRGYELAMVGV